MKIKIKEKYAIDGESLFLVAIFYDCRIDIRFNEDDIGEAVLEIDEDYQVAWFDPPFNFNLEEDYGKVKYNDHPELIEDITVLLYYDSKKDLVHEITEKDIAKLQINLKDNLCYQLIDFGVEEFDTEE